MARLYSPPAGQRDGGRALLRGYERAALGPLIDVGCRGLGVWGLAEGHDDRVTAAAGHGGADL